MIKVLIIDDEPLVRVGLKSMLAWEELGYKIIGEALNGQHGLELIIKNKPDIVITDIKMPVLDGLEMMRRAFAAGRRPKFVILSSYDDFPLVKQAMKQGAEEYLIKLDLEAETLINTLTAVRDKILTEREKSENEERLEKNLQENMDILREGFFKQVISKPLQDRSALEEEAAYLGIELGGLIACASIRINNIEIFKKYDSTEVQSFKTSILNTIDEIVNDIFKGYTFSWNKGEFIVVFSGDGGMEPETYRKKAGNMGERLVKTLKQYFNLSISIGISQTYREYTELAQAYFEGCRAAQHSYYYYSGSQPVLFFDEVPKGEGEQKQIDITEAKNLLPKAIELHDVEMIGAVFEAVISVLDQPTVQREQAYDLCFQIAYLISGVAGLNEAQLKEIIGYEASLSESILTLGTLAEIINWLIGLEQRLSRFITRNDEQKNHRLIAKAKKYILDHYAEEISLNQVAEAINISPGYLSTIFRQYTGIRFTDYVTEIKIGEAKKLLRESEYKIYEISEMLGYQNAYYFSKVFKKITGMTPSEFSGKQF